jgi:hypothetical protein
MTIDALRKDMTRQKEITKAVTNAAYNFCPAWIVAKQRVKNPCVSCRKAAAKVMVAFFAELPAGPITGEEMRPVAEAIMSISNSGG